MINSRQMANSLKIEAHMSKNEAPEKIYRQLLDTIIISCLLNRSNMTNYKEAVVDAISDLIIKMEPSGVMLHRLNTIKYILQKQSLYEDPLLAINNAIDDEIKVFMLEGYENFCHASQILECVKYVSFNLTVQQKWRTFCMSIEDRTYNSEIEDNPGIGINTNKLFSLIGVYLYLMEGIKVFFSVG